MSKLLETLLAFVGVMFVLALAAQSIQELIKAMFTIKAQTLFKAVEGLVRESVRAQGQWSIDADAILKELVRRLQALGQDGVRKGAIRLDTLPAPKLRELLEGIDPGLVPGLPVDRTVATSTLAAIASQAEQWYDLAVAPVDERYRRRMRGFALLASAIVVIPLNAGANRIYEASRADTAFQRRVSSAVARYDSMTKAADDSLRDLAAAGTVAASRPDSTAPTDTSGAVVGAAATPPRVMPPRASAAAERAALEDLIAEGGGLLKFGPPSRADLGKPSWWLGIIVSVLFVSLGAPFWHDLLETIFGLKNRLRGPSVPEAKKAEREMLEETGSRGGLRTPAAPSAEAARSAERLIQERAARLPDMT